MTTDNDSIRSKSDNGADEAPNDKPAEAAEGSAGTAAPSELDTLKAERDKLRDQLLRTAADFDNFRKRTKRDLDDARARSKGDVIRELLPVFDNLERALATVGGASDLGSVVEGVRMVLKLFEDTAERMGLAKVASIGERFDPAVHEAIQQKETDEKPPGTVLDEVTPGYRFGDRLVRPAMVIVARKPAAKSEPAPAASAADGASTNEQSNTEQKDADKTA